MKLFTRDEARAMLPRLREELIAMQADKREVEALRTSLAEVAQTTTGNGHVRDEGRLREQRRRAEELVARLNGALTRVNGWGIEIKTVDEGLADFPSERDGRVVYLCWRLGEDDIGWWHEVEAGFAGRQPLS